MKQSIQSKLKEINEAQQNYKTVVQKHGAVLVKEIAEDIFESFPMVRAIQWVQYTPYFNDGEPCYFGIHRPAFALEPKFRENLTPKETNCLRSYYGLDDSFVLISSRIDDLPPTACSGQLSAINLAMDEFYGYLESVPEVMEETFGDHKQITITREGTQTEEYSHE